MLKIESKSSQQNPLESKGMYCKYCVRAYTVGRHVRGVPDGATPTNCHWITFGRPRTRSSRRTQVLLKWIAPEDTISISFERCNTPRGKTKLRASNSNSARRILFVLVVAGFSSLCKLVRTDNEELNQLNFYWANSNCLLIDTVKFHCMYREERIDVTRNLRIKLQVLRTLRGIGIACREL